MPELERHVPRENGKRRISLFLDGQFEDSNLEGDTRECIKITCMCQRGFAVESSLGWRFPCFSQFRRRSSTFCRHKTMAASRSLAIIVGVGPGTGAAIAKRFSKEGLDVALLARNVGEACPA